MSNFFRASTRKLSTVTQHSANVTAKSITVTFNEEAKSTLDVVFDVRVIPALIGVLATHLNDTIGDVDHADRPEMQTLQTGRVHVAMNEQGQIALLIGLQGGGDLPIQIDRSVLAALDKEIDEALAATDTSKHN